VQRLDESSTSRHLCRVGDRPVVQAKRQTVARGLMQVSANR